MTQKAKWRLAHIMATVLGAIMLGLSARHDLVLNGPDLRGPDATTSSMTGMIVGAILLVRFLSGRHRPTLYLALGFLGSGMLLGVNGYISSMPVRDTAGWTGQLGAASHIMSDLLISSAFLASWAAYRWQAALDRRIPALAQVGLLVAITALLAYLAFAVGDQFALSKAIDLLCVAIFATGLIGYGLKIASQGGTMERWLVLAGIFLIYGQVLAGIFREGASVAYVGIAELMTLGGYTAAFVGTVLSTYELFQRAEHAMQQARSRNEELQREVVLRKQAEQESRQLALVDPLTNTYNRRGFTALATHVREIARRQQRPVHILLIDLDRFKRINDTFGHTVGDQALIEFGKILTATFRKSDVVARTGGDEFCIFLAEPDEGIQTALARLRQHVDDSNEAGTHSYRLEFSVGVARAMPDDDASIHALVEMADEAMYEEKRLREGAA
ncbi:MAG TPA: diguanylate cyclase [Candidatus Dormibacteraeota bacterium]